MLAPLIVVTGVGTGVGKTHVAVALLMAWGRVARVAGYKPVETGVDAATPEDDISRLERASTFHVKHSQSERLSTPVSPHLAAEREGRVLDVDTWVANVGSLRESCEGVVVELAGGLFSPITSHVLNVDLIERLGPTKVLLVGMDRLGILHEVIATTRATDLPFDVVLSAPERTDASTGTNAAELRRFVTHCVRGSLARTTSQALANDTVISSLISEVRVARGPS
jgi:dethiobiotin synthetase